MDWEGREKGRKKTCRRVDTPHPNWGRLALTTKQQHGEKSACETNATHYFLNVKSSLWGPVFSHTRQSIFLPIPWMCLDGEDQFFISVFWLHVVTSCSPIFSLWHEFRLSTRSRVCLAGAASAWMETNVDCWCPLLTLLLRIIMKRCSLKKTSPPPSPFR